MNAVGNVGEVGEVGLQAAHASVGRVVSEEVGDGWEEEFGEDRGLGRVTKVQSGNRMSWKDRGLIVE